MNQAISNALLFNLIITFVVILLAFFVGSMSYSKASKVNNRIVEEIEKQAEAIDDSRNQTEIINNAYANAACDILTWLARGDDGNSSGIGYRLIGNSNRRCPNPDTLVNNLNIAGDTSAEEVQGVLSGNNAQGDACDFATNPYEYCVYRVNTCDEGESCYTYYHVITYMYFDVPIVADLIRIPVHGETMGFRIQNS